MEGCPSRLNVRFRRSAPCTWRRGDPSFDHAVTATLVTSETYLSQKAAAWTAFCSAYSHAPSIVLLLCTVVALGDRHMQPKLEMACPLSVLPPTPFLTGEVGNLSGLGIPSPFLHKKALGVEEPCGSVPDSARGELLGNSSRPIPAFVRPLRSP